MKEYRVVWKRYGLSRKTRKFSRKNWANAFLKAVGGDYADYRLLLSAASWDDKFKGTDLPPIEYSYLESRDVSEWTQD